MSNNDIERFAAWSGDHNPLHVNSEFARETSFGRTEMHGMLSVINVLGAIQLGLSDPLRTLEIEFRGPLFPETAYAVETVSSSGKVSITVSAGDAPLLVIRGDSAKPGLTQGEDDRSAGDAVALDARARDKGMRLAAADRQLHEFESGFEIAGTYSTDPPPESATASGNLTPVQVRVLGLCSYVVGMEMPGLRSLFTSVRLRFADRCTGTTSVDSNLLCYRARTIRFDSQFRMLDAELEVATPEGEFVAAAELRSYVRYTPIVRNLAALAAQMDVYKPNLAGRVALVCGGSRGLGADLASALALAGCRVFASSRGGPEGVQPLSEQPPGQLALHTKDVEFLRGDAGDKAWCSAALEIIRARHGRLDILVLNACAPPAALRLGPESAALFDDYLNANLRLASTPLMTFLPILNESSGTVVCISSSFVDEPQPGFAHYGALKNAVEGVVRSAARESSSLRTLIVRPPRLRTSWNDAPAAILGTIPADWVAAGVIARLAGELRPGQVELLAEFSAPQAVIPDESAHADDDSAAAAFELYIAATFTGEPLIPGLEFWFRELGTTCRIRMAGYGQVLQELLNPASGLSTNGRGLNIVLLRVGDWLHELPAEKLASEDFLGTFFHDTLREYVEAFKAHRQHASAATLLVVCPSISATSSALENQLKQVELEIRAGLQGVPGLEFAFARDFHEQYGVAANQIADPLRDKIAHVPYQDAYLHTLATIVMRCVHRKLLPRRKVVVVDCDNTLWRGVVGEAGPEGLEFDAQHLQLHAALDRLSQSGVLVCLCSKNEEADVWSVFEKRGDLGLPRNRIVAAMINWQPKSENIRALAARLNLGLDSFVFIDDNPVECAEVAAACPEVLTLAWPQDRERAIRLLNHTWELDVVDGTREDQQRTELYRQEFRRQTLQQETRTFRDFIESLNLVVEIAPLDPGDLKRASQLTLRTNQFNFTTRRIDEGEMQALLAGGMQCVRSVKVRDRFGDYGFVGLVVAEPKGDLLVVDTFLLSCRVLGRGVEHQMAAAVGRLAVELGADAVRIRVATTPRNSPARRFVEAICPVESVVASDALFESDMPADQMAELRFEPSDERAVLPQDQGDEPAAHRPARGNGSPRVRERLIARTAFELSCPNELAAAITGIAAPPVQSTESNGLPATDIARFVYAVFARALKLPESQIRQVDRLDALGCGSFKIVEITVELIGRFPWLPGTLLFEHRSVSEIVQNITALSAARQAPVASEIVHKVSVSDQPDARRCSDIAVVGMGVRCAGVKSPDELWKLLSVGGATVGRVPTDRKYFFGELHDERPHFAALLDDVDCFDAGFFDISPREGEAMDPQLRMFLEVAWGALEDAGCVGTEKDVNTGVFAGIMYGDYVFRANLAAKANENPYRCWEGFSLANRLSQILGVCGPSVAVDTACSSSGTALHLACQALNTGDCTTAIVGGVNLILDPERFVQLGQLGILSDTGRCRPFGAEADGTVFGEGAGVVVLRSLSDALRHGNKIYGVIKGTGLSTGNGTVGFTAPNPQAQAEAIRRSLRAARIDPRTVTYVETHGTGTSLGDPIEIRGLSLSYQDKELWDADIETTPHCKLGSIKPNIGHLEAGAGIVGLIKVLLQLDRQMLVPSITSEQTNPQIPFQETPFEIQRSLAPWEPLVAKIGDVPVAIPRRAGLSSFGVGGANAHVIIEEAPTKPSMPKSSFDRPCHLLTLSARSDESLDLHIAAVKRHLEARPDLPIGNVCYTANVRRSHFEHRLAVVATSRDELLGRLEQLDAGDEPGGAVRGTPLGSGSRPRIAFLFTGQGSQFPGMGKALYETQPAFRTALNRCAEILGPLLDRPLQEVLFVEEGSRAADLLNQTGFTQPALFAIEYSLSELWRSWGVRPDVVLGHSVGEIAALCVAGGVTLEDGCRLIAARGRLMQSLPSGGGMRSVMASEARVLRAIAGYEDCASIAAINGPEHVVITGVEAALDEICRELQAEQIKIKPLAVSHAFHSPLMDPMLAEYAKVVNEIRFSAPKIPFVSGVRGAIVSEEVLKSEYWIRQVRDPVRFTDGMAALEQCGVEAYLEVGPHPVLLGMGRLCLEERGDQRVWLPSLRRDADCWQTLLTSAGQLYALGTAVDWIGFDAPYAREFVPIPTYSFRPQRLWIDAPPPSVERQPQREVSRNKLYEIVWKKRPRAENGKFHANCGNWLILADSTGTGAAVADLLEQNGGKCTLIRPGAGFHSADGGGYTINPTEPSDFAKLWRTLSDTGSSVRGVIHLWSLDAPSSDGSGVESLTASRRLSLESSIHLLQTLVRDGAPSQVWFVTRGAVARGPGVSREPISFMQSPLWGLGRSLALEHSQLWGGLVDLSRDGDERLEIKGLVRELLAPDGEDQVVFQDETRFVPRLMHADYPRKRDLRLSAEATYLVTGGVGALGLHMARWLVSNGARRLILASRRGMKSPAAESALKSLADSGATVEIIAADVSSENDVDMLFEHVRATGLPLRGVIHAAGIDVPQPLAKISPAELSSALAPKMSGGWLLHDRSRTLDLDLFICFSSISSILGSGGRAHYGAANAFLDGLVYERRRLGLPALSVNWGPWKGGGMATAADLESYERIGNHGLDPEEAAVILDALIAADCTQSTVADIDWAQFRGIYEARRPRPILAEIDLPNGDLPNSGPRAPAESLHSKTGGAVNDGMPAVNEQSEWVGRLQKLPKEQRLRELSTLLRTEIAKTLGFRSPDEIRLNKTFHEMGMDSLLAVEFANRLRKRLGVRNPALVFDYPLVDKLAAYLLGQVAPTEPPASSNECPERCDAAIQTAAAPQGITGYFPGVEAELVEFQKRAWPHRRVDLLTPRWKWMYVESAQRLAIEPRVWLYRDACAIVAHNGAIPVKLKIGTEKRLTAWFADTMVLESYRNQALGSRLLMQASEELPFSLSLGQTEQMREINLKMGWIQVAPLETAQLLIHPETVLKGKLSAPMMLAASWSIRASTALRTMFQNRAPLDVRQVSRFDARHDRLWEIASRDIPCGVVRDASYLNWKYVDQPGQDILRLELVEAGEVRGVVVLMFRDADDSYPYRRALLVDLVAPLSDARRLKQLVQIAGTAAAERDADALQCLHIGQRLTRALRQSGFLIREPRRFLLVNPGDLPPEARRQVLAGSDWFVTQGDSDIDRP